MQSLADARLMTTGRDEATGQETVEVAHEALIRGWERLRRWVEEDREFLTWRQRLEATLREWERLERDEGALLRGGRLAEAERWLAERGGDLSADERSFIQVSVALREREVQARERLRRRITVGLAVGLVLMAVLAFVAFSGQKKARDETEIATSRELAAAAMSQLEVDPERSILLAMEAVRAVHIFETDEALRRALLASHVRAVLRGHKDMVFSAVFSPDGKRMVTVSRDGTAQVWDVLAALNTGAAMGEALAVLHGHEDWVSSATFSPDGRWVVTASADKMARVWEAATGKALAVLRGHEERVNSAAFSPDGQWVVTASWDGAARIYAVHIEDLMELARRRVTRELTCQERVQFLHEELE